MQLREIPGLKKKDKFVKHDYFIFSSLLSNSLLERGGRATYKDRMKAKPIDLSQYTQVFFPIHAKNHFSLMVVFNNNVIQSAGAGEEKDPHWL